MTKTRWVDIVRWMALGSAWGATIGAIIELFLIDGKGSEMLCFYLALAYWLTREDRHEQSR